MIEIRRMTLDGWQIWKELRLRALKAAPTAYGETYANAVAADDYYWQKWWIERGDTALRTMAFVAGVPAGQAACVHFQGPDDHPMLVAMWVEEEFRGSGVADALVRDVLAWTAERGYAGVQLGVTEGNEAARKVYLRHGFRPTGERETLVSHPELQIEHMEYLHGS